MPAVADPTKAVTVFPDSPRVVYTSNPLEEVICQLKFPPILRIDSELPAALQDELRGEYPLLVENAATPIELPGAIAKVLAAELPGFSGNRVYQFASADDVWKISLTRDFLAISTRLYRHWDEFRKRTEIALRALVSLYHPAFFTRIGLRYRNVISPLTLGLRDAQWRELLQPHILGELASPEVAPAIRYASRDVLIALDEAGSQVRIRHGLNKPALEPDASYVIDSDFYFENRTEINDALAKLDLFHWNAGRLFRWCITPRLHELLGPQPV
jgi:uncharacterized protein (TIGR04255 family)